MKRPGVPSPSTVSPRSVVLRALLVLIVALALTGCEELETQSQDPPADTPSGPAEKPVPRESHSRAKPKAKRRNQIGTAAAMLKKIPARAERSAVSYQRIYFGDGWTTHDGCTTRELVLEQESRRGEPVGCKVRSGLWKSEYDGDFVKKSRNLDIDHLVPLAEAWRSGASRWTAGTRVRYANDLSYSGTLTAVTAETNRSKSDSDPAGWMPPRSIHHCKYIGTWIAVKYRWHLTADPDERSVLSRFVKNCGRKSDVPKPRRAKVRVSRRPVGRASPKRSKRSGSNAPRHLSGGKAGKKDPHFSTCKEAKANGYGNYVRGKDPEYSWYRDADGDGVVCE